MIRKAILLILAVTLCALSPLWAPSGEEDLGTVLDKVGQTVQGYFEGMFSIACTETLVRQPLDGNLAPKGSPDRFEYGYIVLKEAADTGAPFVAKAFREQALVNGKPPAAAKRSRIPDPASVYTEPLTFLLAREQSRYDFALEGYRLVEGRRLLVLAFNPKAYVPPEVKWEGNSFRLSRVRMKGRGLIDPESHEVVQLETELVAPFEFRKPALQRLGPLITFRSSPKMRLERSDTTIRYQAAYYSDPAQRLLLPLSAESLTVIRGASVPALRTTQTFSNYKRFIATVKIKLPQ